MVDGVRTTHGEDGLEAVGLYQPNGEASPEQSPGPPLTTSLNKPGADRKVMVKCLNPNPQPLTIRSGITVGTYTSVEAPPLIAGAPTLKGGHAGHPSCGQARDPRASLGTVQICKTLMSKRRKVKKKDGKWRFFVDYRRLTAVAEQNAYPLPRIDESLDAFAGSQYFSTLDLVSGYWQVPPDEDAKEKSAFITCSGLRKWRVLPFGLTSGPATFQRLMERVLHGLHWQTLLLYLDDVVVIAPDFKTHLHRLEELFQRLWQAGLKVIPTKCELLQSQVRYLSHIVPRGVRKLQGFLGTVGYYMQYIPKFATIATPLHRPIGKEEPWRWTREEQATFDTMCHSLTTAPVLGYPDSENTYILDTDAGGCGVGAVLSQQHRDQERVIAYYSKPHLPRSEILLGGGKTLSPVLVQTGVSASYGLCLLAMTLPQEGAHSPGGGLARGASRIQIQTGTLRRIKAWQRRWLKQTELRRLPTALLVTTGNHIRAGQRSPGLHVRRPAIQASSRLVETILRPEALAQQTTQLARPQSEGNSVLAIMYRALESHTEVPSKQLELGSQELRVLHSRRESLRIRQDGVMEARVALHGQTRWCADTIAIPEDTALVVASALDERVFCYLRLPEQIHTNKGAQFENQLMEGLCQLWKVSKTCTTSYHPLANRIVERNNQGLGDSLRGMLLERGQEELDEHVP
ncbi:uncharacterized protein [Watersipora subatra]|uniref:uncharacterized protein n=1 Tax=Watersipora subatra TaxID=2589382 RepID=UPI00355C1581